MEQTTKTRQLLLGHYRTYPKLQLQDLFKFLHQSAFGCEHMVSALEAATAYIRQERQSCCVSDRLIDALDGAYSRVHLSCPDCCLSDETFGKLFVASAKPEPNGDQALEQKLSVAQALVEEQALPFPPDAFKKALEDWKALGYPAIHHSDAFRAAYQPAYRVIANRYVPFLSLFAKIDDLLQKGSAIVAIDGGSASGKTTLSQMLEDLYDCTVFHMDDFFLRPEQRTAERFAEPGGNVDRERFLEEVLLPLGKKQSICYRKFDCTTMQLSAPVTVTPKKLTVIEGVYSMHPALRSHYDLTVFLNISPQLQKARIKQRNRPQMAQRFFTQWIPLEQLYFSTMQVQQRSDLNISIEL